MITKEQKRSDGDFYLLGDHYAKSDATDIGLCSQGNKIWDKLTVKEHFVFFGIMRGL